MTYYLVPASMDQKPLYRAGNGPRRRNGWFLIGNELLTAAECKRRNAPVHLLQPVQLKKTQIYFCFGARFAVKEA